MLRRIGVLASLAVTGAMFMGVQSAQAATGDVAVCVFTGLSGALSNPLPGATQPGAVTLPPNTLSGTYSFSGRGNCAGRDTASGQVILPDTDPLDPNDPNWGNATISSDGGYDNIVCGTGWAADELGDGTTVDPDNPAVATISNVGYEIFFVGGNGPLRIGFGPATRPNAEAANIQGDYVGAGAVHITPKDIGASNSNCVTHPVTEFEVAGGFAAVGL